MSRTRQFQQRGKPVQVEEVGDLYAVRAGHITKARALDPDAVVKAVPGLSKPALAAFRDAGWEFVRAPQPPAGAPTTRLYVKAGGRPVLGTNRLTVKLAADVKPADAEALLARHGGTVIDRLTFAPNLYQVAVNPPAGKDALDVAGELTAEPAVEFAEPEFLEVLGRR
jgi:hypothetical protein